MPTFKPEDLQDTTPVTFSPQDLQQATSTTKPSDVAVLARQHLSKIRAGKDIPPNSPLSPLGASAFSRFMQGAGLPDSWDSLKHLSQRFDDLGPAAMVNLPQTKQEWESKPSLEAITSIFPGGSVLSGVANIPANLQDGNYAGALGSAVIPAAALAHSRLPTSMPSDPIIGYGPPETIPRSGPMRALGTVAETADQIFPSALRPRGLKTAAQFLSQKTVTPAIRASDLTTPPKWGGTDFPFQPTSSPVLSSEPSMGSAPLHNPQDIMTKAGLPELWQGSSPPEANAFFGDAPVQPVNPIAGPHPSGINGLNLPNVAQARTIPGTLFQPREFAQLMEQLRRSGASRSELHTAQQQGISNIIKDALEQNTTPNQILKEVAAKRRNSSKDIGSKTKQPNKRGVP